MVRKLAFNEVGRIAESAVKFIEQTQYKYGFDLPHFISNLTKMMMNGNAICFVDEVNGKIISGIGFTIATDIYSPYRIMGEMWFYGEGAGGLKVIKAAEKWANENKIDQIVMGSTLYNEDRNAKLYAKLGFERDSSTYRKRITCQKPV